MKKIPDLLKYKISSINNLPTLPQVASKLITIINSEKSASSDVSRIVSQDMALSAKVLRLSNSAYYGVPKTITNIEKAVVVLGFKVIQTIVISLTVFDIFPKDKSTRLFDRKGFWSHCLETAVLSQIIAQKAVDNKIILRISPEDAFCIGLLHDIGKVVMEQYLHEDFVKVVNHMSINSISFFESETTHFGYSHGTIAGLLFENWNLPENLTSSVIYHHEPHLCEAYNKEAYIIHYADYLIRKINQKKNKNAVLPPLREEVTDILKIGTIKLADMESLLDAEMKKMDIYLELLSC